MIASNDLNPNDLLRLAELLKMHSETIRLFSDTSRLGNGGMSRVTAISIAIEGFAEELSDIACKQGANVNPDVEHK